MIEVNLGIVLLAGMLATFNPCGFAMLPAYLGALVLGQEESRTGNFLRAIRFSIGMALGLTLVFGTFSLVVLPFSILIDGYLPWVTMAMAIVLVVTGAMSILGRGFGIGGLLGGNLAPGKSFVSQVGYGVAFAAASLSCTVGPFLAASATALRSGSAVNIILTFLSYGLGMATMVLLLALVTAASGPATVRKLRTKTKQFERGIGVLLLLVGAYLFSYALYEFAQMRGSAAANGVVEMVIVLQSYVVRLFYMMGPALIGLLVLVLSSIALGPALLSRLRNSWTRD